MVKKGVKAQTNISPVSKSSKKVIVKGLGFIIFVIGAFIIISSYLGTPIVGNVVIDSGFASTASIAGILLEVIGVALMVIKIDYAPCEKPAQIPKNHDTKK